MGVKEQWKDQNEQKKQQKDQKQWEDQRREINNGKNKGVKQTMEGSKEMKETMGQRNEINNGRIKRNERSETMGRSKARNKQWEEQRRETTMEGSKETMDQ